MSEELYARVADMLLPPPPRRSRAGRGVLSRGAAALSLGDAVQLASMPSYMKPPPGERRVMDDVEKMARLEADQLGDIQAGRTPRRPPGQEEEDAVAALTPGESLPPAAPIPLDMTANPAPAPPPPETPPPPAPPSAGELAQRTLLRALLAGLGVDVSDMADSLPSRDDFYLACIRAVAPVAVDSLKQHPPEARTQHRDGRAADSRHPVREEQYGHAGEVGSM
jgi:hypothetical protein